MSREKSKWNYWAALLLSFLFFATISTSGAFATEYHATIQLQADTSVTLRGRVVTTEEPPQPLAGANVQIKGSSQIVETDEDGYFNITAKRGDVLVFSIIGYQPYEHTVTRSTSTLSIPLKEDVGALGEVVVTGMTEQQRKHIASSVATVNISSNIGGKPITQLSQALQGGVTGIQVTQGSGIPGRDAAQILIRGIGTTGNSNPLILVDGIPMEMNDIDPLTVESITVLKDAAAAASYGSRAANGVIVVTTKRGIPGRVTVTYDGYYGVQSSTFLPNTADGPVYMRMANEARENSGLSSAFSDDIIAKTASGEDPLRYPNTNWLDLMINRAAPITNHSVSVSGGNNLARFAVTGNYMYQEGMLPVTHNQRFNLRANTSITLTDDFVVNLDLLAIRGDRKEPQRPSNDTYGGNRLLEDLYRVPPYILPRYPDRDGKKFYQSYLTLANPLAVVEQNGYQRWRDDVTSVNIQPKWRVFPGFNLRGQFNYRVNSTHNTEFSDGFVFFDYFSGNQVAPTNWNARRTSGIGRNTYFFLSGSADYSYRKSGHNLFAILGGSQERSAEGNWNQWSILSAYSKINYSFKDRYLLELSGRVDGSSRFGPGNKFGFFPSIAAGWNVHNEKFMENVNFISNLKLRASYGTLGNQNIGLYQYQSPIRTPDGLETRFGNPDITWESVDMLDIGMDLGLFEGNKLEITIDYYRKLTRDMLQNPEVSLVGGMISPTSVTTPSNPPINSGDVLNTGFEFAANYFERLNKNLTLSFRPGFTYNINEIKFLPGIVMTSPNQTEWMIRSNQIGYPIRSYYGYRTGGLLQASDFDGAGNPLVPVISSSVKPGDIKYLDLSGDGKITEDDMTMLENQVPKLNYFANLGFTYRNFDFELLLQGTGKSAAALSGMMALPLDESFDGGIPTEYYSQNYWTPDRTDARFPRLRAQPADNKLSSDFWLENGAYLRFKYIQAGYTFNSSKMKVLGINAMRVYVNTQNPFTITSMRLMDPESRGNQWSYPIMRFYTIGVNVKF
ncbi:MAG: TonB-dependent receptor [Niabella sp.]